MPHCCTISIVLSCSFRQNFIKQVCIPVGCIPSTAVVYAGGSAQRPSAWGGGGVAYAWGYLSEGVLAGGGCLRLRTLITGF